MMMMRCNASAYGEQSLGNYCDFRVNHLFASIGDRCKYLNDENRPIRIARVPCVGGEPQTISAFPEKVRFFNDDRQTNTSLHRTRARDSLTIALVTKAMGMGVDEG